MTFYSRFLLEAFRLAFRRRLLVPVLLLAITLTGTNAMVAASTWAQGESPSPLFLAAALIRVGGTMLLTVGILRILTGSQRSTWLPDGGFWLYTLTLPTGVALAVSLRHLIGATDGNLLLHLAASALITIIEAPLAVWLTAIAVEKPLAWDPRPWLRAWSLWLPPLMLWALLFRPVVVAHAALSSRLLSQPGDWFWPLAIFDGALSVLILLAAVSLKVTAYRRVIAGRPG